MLNSDQRYDIISSCLVKWDSIDEKTDFFEDNFDEWIDQIPEDFLPLVVQLLKDFDYYSQSKVNGFLVRLHENICSLPEFDATKAIYTFIPSKKGIENSSIDYLIDYKKLNKISKFQVATNLEQYSKIYSKDYGKTDYIVIIDDYCGSGDSLISYMKEYKTIIGKRNIIYVVTYVMKEAISKIYDEAKKSGIRVSILFINQGQKAFNSPAFAGKGQIVRKMICEISSHLKLQQDYYLGHKESESLVAFYNDTPNNTLAIFWCDSPVYFSIFPRDCKYKERNKRPTPKAMREEKNNRNVQNYVVNKKRGLNE